MVPFAFAEPSQSGGTWFFSVPTKDVEEIRALRKVPGKGTDVGLVSKTLRDKAGVEITGNWWSWPEWDNRVKTAQRDRYKKNGERANGLAATLTHQLTVENGVALQSLEMNCTTMLESTGIDFFTFNCDTGPLPVLEGQWREMAAWETGDTTWLMWQRFPEVERREKPAPNGVEWHIAPPPGASEDAMVRKDAHFEADAALSFTVEILFFKTTPVAVGQLAKAGPENREKAAKWLIARGLPWRKVRICQRLGPEKRKWWMSHEKRGVGKSSGAGFKSVLNLDVTGNRADGVLSVQVGMSHMEGDPNSDLTTGSISLENVTPAWNFVLPKDCGGVNAVTYRVVKE